ncbi:hypothetical protein DFP72DRAFT_1166473 [Ephemerocybe angulata]|uniref:Uncharacterized protein n=1 Tax=Ephemerocybe angulata TaxID=980116 RepID=A0A8H6I986_9AGAR|nr:hypothetical protein DFP72DRAFT_1166473 [Tulosesus angulatus]
MSTPYRSTPRQPAAPHPTPLSAMANSEHSRRATRAPILNPFEKFNQTEFDNWIGGITGALRQALGQAEEEQPVEDRTHNPPGQAYQDVNMDMEPEEEYEAEDTFANIKVPRALNKGKARDPREGPGLSEVGNKEEPIEILSGSEEEVEEEGEEEEEVDEEEYDGANVRLPIRRPNSESEEEDEEEDYEDGDQGHYEDSEDEEGIREAPLQREELSDEDYESDLVPSPQAKPQSPEIIALDSDEDEQDDEEPAYRESSDNEHDGYERGSSPIEAEYEEFLADDEEAVDSHAAEVGHYVRNDHVEEDEGLSDEEVQPLDVDTSFPPRHNQSPAAEIRKPDIQDPWSGARTYAEDFYAGGDRPLQHAKYLNADHLEEGHGEGSDVEEEVGDNEAFVPEHPIDLGNSPPAEIRNVWEGPETYAEDFYSGGDFNIAPGQILEPHHLGPEQGNAEPEIIDLDSDNEIESMAPPASAVFTSTQGPSRSPSPPHPAQLDFLALGHAQDDMLMHAESSEPISHHESVDHQEAENEAKEPFIANQPLIAAIDIDEGEEAGDGAEQTPSDATEDLAAIPTFDTPTISGDAESETADVDFDFDLEYPEASREASVGLKSDVEETDLTDPITQVGPERERSPEIFTVDSDSEEEEESDKGPENDAEEARERQGKEAREEEAREKEQREREAREREARDQEAKEREAREQEAMDREARDQREREDQLGREKQALEQREREDELAREQEVREREAREQADDNTISTEEPNEFEIDEAAVSVGDAMEIDMTAGQIIRGIEESFIAADSEAASPPATEYTVEDGAADVAMEVEVVVETPDAHVTEQRHTHHKVEIEEVTDEDADEPLHLRHQEKAGDRAEDAPEVEEVEAVTYTVTEMVEEANAEREYRDEDIVSVEEETVEGAYTVTEIRGDEQDLDADGELDDEDVEILSVASSDDFSAFALGDDVGEVEEVMGEQGLADESKTKVRSEEEHTSNASDDLGPFDNHTEHVSAEVIEVLSTPLVEELPNSEAVPESGPAVPHDHLVEDDRDFIASDVDELMETDTEEALSKEAGDVQQEGHIATGPDLPTPEPTPVDHGSPVEVQEVESEGLINPQAESPASVEEPGSDDETMVEPTAVERLVVAEIEEENLMVASPHDDTPMQSHPSPSQTPDPHAPHDEPQLVHVETVQLTPPPLEGFPANLSQPQDEVVHIVGPPELTSVLAQRERTPQLTIPEPLEPKEVAAFPAVLSDPTTQAPLLSDELTSADVLSQTQPLPSQGNLVNSGAHTAPPCSFGDVPEESITTEDALPPTRPASPIQEVPEKSLDGPPTPTSVSGDTKVGSVLDSSVGGQHNVANPIDGNGDKGSESHESTAGADSQNTITQSPPKPATRSPTIRIPARPQNAGKLTVSPKSTGTKLRLSLPAKESPAKKETTGGKRKRVPSSPKKGKGSTDNPEASRKKSLKGKEKLDEDADGEDEIVVKVKKSRLDEATASAIVGTNRPPVSSLSVDSGSSASSAARLLQPDASSRASSVAAGSEVSEHTNPSPTTYKPPWQGVGLASGSSTLREPVVPPPLQPNPTVHRPFLHAHGKKKVPFLQQYQTMPIQSTFAPPPPPPPPMQAHPTSTQTDRPQLAHIRRPSLVHLQERSSVPPASPTTSHPPPSPQSGSPHTPVAEASQSHTSHGPTPISSRRTQSMKTVAPNTHTPVTRSHCRFHKISIPRDEFGPKIYFIVPGCSLTKANIIRDEDIDDHGDATYEDSQRMVDDIETLGFEPYLIAVIKSLVGAEIMKEREVYYLPLEGEKIVRKAPPTPSVSSSNHKRASSMAGSSNSISAARGKQVDISEVLGSSSDSGDDSSEEADSDYDVERDAREPTPVSPPTAVKRPPFRPMARRGAEPRSHRSWNHAAGRWKTSAELEGGRGPGRPRKISVPGRGRGRPRKHPLPSDRPQSRSVPTGGQSSKRPLDAMDVDDDEATGGKKARLDSI